MILAVLDCRQNLPAQSKSLQSALIKPASSDTAQTSFLLPDLEKQLDPRRLLYRLAHAIDWKGFEKTSVATQRIFSRGFSLSVSIRPGFKIPRIFTPLLHIQNS
jgi:hypothetical protein